ncbi:hypothetical protein Psta_4716 [Pirellula staleyi DSM 6068]|uniref:Uncharacterized protein n=1 Tax=Pirellula staleyi (strain ATCC 27377 / DSM 6068 / ICPB 4128) TaxID=530564 RepID=D2R826_PIRSD|nr:hypothetical protein Psta_4716 [Pirellula staleyi DSM 6068]
MPREHLATNSPTSVAWAGEYQKSRERVKANRPIFCLKKEREGTAGKLHLAAENAGRNRRPIVTPIPPAWGGNVLDRRGILHKSRYVRDDATQPAKNPRSSGNVYVFADARATDHRNR